MVTVNRYAIAVVIDSLAPLLILLVVFMSLRAICGSSKDQLEYDYSHRMMCVPINELTEAVCRGQDSFPWPSKMLVEFREEKIKQQQQADPHMSIEDSGLILEALGYFFLCLAFLLRMFRWLCCVFFY